MVVEVERSQKCPACGTPLSQDRWSAGLCPLCVFELALDDTGIEAELEPDEAPTLQFTPGATFAEGDIQGDRYRIRLLLGRGGMGEVWRAYDLKLRQDVALKALRSELIEDNAALEILRQEVRVAREVISPNVCRVFDLQEVEGQELISMEYVDGTTLQEILRDSGPLELNEAREIATQFLAGLEAIHQAGLIHRDIKPENLMITRTGRVVVMDFGIAKGLAEGKGGRVAGTPAYMSPEQARGRELDARSDLFSSGIVLAEMVEPGGVGSLEDRQRLWEGIHQDSPEISDTPWSKVIAKCVSAETRDRFESASALARALEEVTLRAVGDETARPYPGLSAFQQEDAEFFYGRELEVEALWKKLRRPHLLAVIGPSGAGKSSFLRAGLLPTLTDGWQALIAAPGNRPFANLALALAEQLPEDRSITDALLRFEEPDVAIDLISQWRQGHQQGLIILDQFEELFTQNTEETQQQFAELLGRLPSEADVFVLLSMRDDFLFHCHSFEALQPLLSDLTLLGPPTGAALRRAIVEPALKCGYRFEDEGIIDEMLGEVEGERGALPMVAFAVAQLWERRDRETGLLTRKSYEQIGGVSGALAQHAEAMLDYVGEANAPIVRELFRNLVTAQGTRAARDQEELLSVFPETEGEPFLEPSRVRPTPVPQPQRPAAKHVLNSLIDARLLTSFETPADEEGAEPQQRVEVVHESLLTNWPRLVRWRTQDAQGAQLRDELRTQAKLWDEHSRLEDYLWTGTAFKEYALWRESYPGGLTDVEEAFGAAMVHLAERQKRRRRMVISVVFAALVIGLSVVAGFWRQAVEERRRAEAETRRAEAGRFVALGELEINTYPTAALAWATKSLEISDTLEGRLLALRALQKGPVTVLKSTEELEVVFGRFSPSGELFATSALDEIGLHFQDGRKPLLVHRYSPARNVFARGAFLSEEVLVTEYQGELRRLSVPDGEELQPPQEDRGSLWIPRPDGHFSYEYDGDMITLRWVPYDEGPVKTFGSMADFHDGDIDSTGEWLLYCRGNEALLRSLENWDQEPVVIGEHDARVRGVKFHPDNELVATTDESPRIAFWSKEGRLERTLRPPPNGVVQSLRFHPSGRWLAGHSGGSGTEGLVLWDLSAPADAEPIILGRTDSGGKALIEFHPSKPWLVSGRGGEISFWPLPTRAPWVILEMTVVSGFGDPIFTRDDGWLVAGHVSEPGIRAWPLKGQNNGAAKALLQPTVRYSLVAHPSEDLVAARVEGGAVMVVPLDGRPSRELAGRIGGFSAALDFSPTGRYLAGVPSYGEPDEMIIRVWDLESEAVQELGPVPGTTSFLGFDDERHLRWIGWPSRDEGSGGARVFDLEDGSVEVQVDHEVEMFRLVDAGGRFMVLRQGGPRGEDAVLLRRDLATGEENPITTHGEPAQVFDVAIDSTGRWLASGGDDRIVRVGPVTGEEPHLLFGAQGDTHHLAFSHDGRWVASGGLGSGLCLWPMPDMTQPPLHTLPRGELLARLHAATNLRVVGDSDSPTGWKLQYAPFPGWAEVPEW